ncbi:MAG: 5-(carboxyamino)imidazole ribonucleotide mutase [Alphaproteobacteria bacterium]|nr:5-(carboxyamino)imidazole ribonucleotide mutase [Alphaproteobacteria bacterium]
MAAAVTIGVIMGSQSDWETMRHAVETLEALGVSHEIRIVSAHRTPDRMVDYAKSAEKRGLAAIIAGAGGAAHLPGMTASMTILPVFGVPIESKALGGMDSLLSIVQMPQGVPVGTLAIGRAGAINAALLAASVIALSDTTVREALRAWRLDQAAAVAQSPQTD